MSEFCGGSLKETQPIEQALEIIFRWGGIDGDHHRAWVIDQVVRALTGAIIVSGWPKHVVVRMGQILMVGTKE